MFCEIFLYPDLTLHTLRLVSLWGRPEHTLLPNTLHSTQHTPQEAALQPRDFRKPPYGPERLPYSQETTLQSPQHTQHTLASGRAYPWYPAYTAFKKAPGATQTTRLHSQPTESITKNTQRRQIQRIQKKA